MCRKLHCYGGKVLECNDHKGSWSGKEVHCGVNFQFYIQIFYLLLNRKKNTMNFGWIKIKIKIYNRQMKKVITTCYSHRPHKCQHKNRYMNLLFTIITEMSVIIRQNERK